MTQDERIAANAEAIKGNAEAIRQQTEYLHEIRDYFIPGEDFLGRDPCRGCHLCHMM